MIIALSGGELMQHIYNRKQLEEKETRKYMRQMVSAVDHLHKAGIIHRYTIHRYYSEPVGGHYMWACVGHSNLV